MSALNDYQKLMDERGHDLRKVGVTEIGLSREDALQAVSHLRNAKVPILGGDVWLLQNGRFESTGDSWHLKTNASGARSTSWDQAADYISSYPRPAAGIALFIVVAKRESPESIL